MTRKIETTRLSSKTSCLWSSPSLGETFSAEVHGKSPVPEACTGRFSLPSTLDVKLGNQQNGSMKTTFDLPDGLLKQVKLRALHDGRKLKDAVAQLLRKGLAAARETEHDPGDPPIANDTRTGLPVIQCKKAAASGEEVTAERAADILLAQEVEAYHALGR